MIVYKLLNKSNNKIYIGQTKHNIEQRFYKHSCNNSIIGRAIRKYGKDMFELTVLHKSDNRSQILELEKQEILINNSLVPNGYNIHHGGSGGDTEYRHTQDTIDKIIVANLGKTQSKELIEKRMQKMRGRKIKQEQKSNIKLNQPHRKIVKCSNGKIYDSMSDAAKDLNLSIGNISQILSGKRKQTNGFTFEVILE